MGNAIFFDPGRYPIEREPAMFLGLGLFSGNASGNGNPPTGDNNPGLGLIIIAVIAVATAAGLVYLYPNPNVDKNAAAALITEYTAKQPVSLKGNIIRKPSVVGVEVFMAAFMDSRKTVTKIMSLSEMNCSDSKRVCSYSFTEMLAPGNYMVKRRYIYENGRRDDTVDIGYEMVVSSN